MTDDSDDWPNGRARNWDFEARNDRMRMNWDEERGYGQGLSAYEGEDERRTNRASPAREREDYRQTRRDYARYDEDERYGQGGARDYDRDMRERGREMDERDAYRRAESLDRGEQRQGAGLRAGFAGRGPKGYTRSDDRIREEACDRLMEDDAVDASNIEVAVKDGELTLSGTVDDRRDKRRAEDCVEMIAGVKHVQNNLRIAEAGGAGGGRRAAKR